MLDITSGFDIHSFRSNANIGSTTPIISHHVYRTAYLSDDANQVQSFLDHQGQGHLVYHAPAYLVMYHKIDGEWHLYHSSHDTKDAFFDELFEYIDDFATKRNIIRMFI